MRTLIAWGLGTTLALAAGACGDGAIGGGGPTFTAEHPRIYLPQNRERLVAALAAETPAAKRFRDMVDRQLDGADYYDFQPWHAALLGALTEELRYCEYAVGEVEARVAAERGRIADGERPTVAGDSYLGIGDAIANLALTYDFCTAHVTAAQRDAWFDYAQQAVWNVWHPTEATWGGRDAEWSGWSIDNPSNNYYYSFLRATLTFGLAARGEHPDAEAWIGWFRDTKIADQLVPQFDADLVGGGSREGTGYGVSMRDLFWLYDLWEGSTGERIADLTPHTRASLIEMLHTIVPTLDRIAPIGDHSRDAAAPLFDYHRNYLLNLIRLYPNDPAAAEALYILARSNVPEMDQPFMYIWDFLDETMTSEAEPALHPTFYGPGTGQLFTRSSWATDATWIGTTCGPFTEDHAHEDQGQLLIFRGDWLADDQNMRSRSGIHNEPDVHNLVRLEREGETVRMRRGQGGTLAALAEGEGYVYWSVDAAPSYPESAGVTVMRRDVVFVPPLTIVVFDVAAAAGAQPVWQLSSAYAPVIAGAVATITGEGGRLAVERLLPANGSLSSQDWESLDSDMNGGFRLDSPGDEVFLHVLSLDDGVASSTLIDDADEPGVTLILADGRAVTVRFTRATVGGSVEIIPTSGTPESATLAAGVTSPPER